jgi:hypothetical protein
MSRRRFATLPKCSWLYKIPAPVDAENMVADLKACNKASNPVRADQRVSTRSRILFVDGIAERLRAWRQTRAGSGSLGLYG